MTLLVLPFEPTIVLSVGGLAVLWLTIWFLGDLHTHVRPAATPHLWRCQICATYYPSKTGERLTICPQCGSYNSQEERPTR